MEAKAYAVAVLLTVATVAGSAAALGQTPGGAYPGKLVRIVVPYSPGIAVDLSARAVAPKLGERLGQPVIVENRPGASGIIGTEHAARSAPDGHTLMMAVNTFVINAAIRADLPFDVIKDFAPISMVGFGAQVVTVHASVPVRSMQELVDYAKRNPGKLNYATPGVGAPSHLGTELLKQLTGISLVHVPYKGLPPAVLGHTQGDAAVMLVPVEQARPHIAAGKLRALAAAGRQRTHFMPDLPTVAEAGVPDFGVDVWYGILTPAGTPAPVLARLNQEVTRILETADTRAALAKLGMEPAPTSREEFAAVMANDLVKWKKVAAAANIRADK
jgi:tripartite-type tricarboxylate transporter receptor subunit TctC